MVMVTVMVAAMADSDGDGHSDGDGGDRMRIIMLMITSLACSSGVTCLCDVVLLDGMKKARVVVFGFTQLEEVATRLWAFIHVEIYNYVS